MNRSHDHWCPNCKAHFSPLDFPEGCPVCEHPGIYDPNDDYGTQAALEEVRDDGKRGHVADLAQAHGFDPAEFALESSMNTPGPEEQAKLLFVIETLSSSLGFVAIKEWLAMHSSLDSAYQAAKAL